MTTFLEKQGIELKDPSTCDVLTTLEELEDPGTPYVNIRLHDEEGWSLEVYESGAVEFYNGNPKKRLCRKNVPHEEIVQMWRMMQDGNRDGIKKTMMQGK